MQGRAAMQGYWPKQAITPASGNGHPARPGTWMIYSKTAGLACLRAIWLPYQTAAVTFHDAVWVVAGTAAVSSFVLTRISHELRTRR